MPVALGMEGSGTSRMIVAEESDQKPPMVIPSSARAAMRKAKFGAAAIRSSEAVIVAAFE